MTNYSNFIQKIFFYVIFIFFIFSLFYSINKIFETNFNINFYIYFALVVLFITIFLAITELFLKSYQVTLVIILYTSLLSLYLFEFFITTKINSIKLKNHIPFHVLADEKNISWDERTSYEFYIDLKKEVKDILPNFYPYLLLKKKHFQRFRS